MSDHEEEDVVSTEGQALPAVFWGWVKLNRIPIVVFVMGASCVAVAAKVGFTQYYENGGSVTVESISQELLGPEENELIPEVLSLPAPKQNIEEKPALKETLSVSHSISCTILTPVVTYEVMNGAKRRGCDYLAMPYIAEMRLCNAVTQSCTLLHKQDL
jgi:hypothetical protein